MSNLAYLSKLKVHIQSLLRSAVCSAPITDLSDNEAAEAWLILDTLEKILDKRKKVLREKLLKSAEAKGSPTDMGGQSLRLQCSEVVREKRVSKTPDTAKTRKLMQSKELPFDEAFSKINKVVADPSKLEALLNLGKLEQQDINRLHTVTWALQFRPTPRVKKELSESISASSANELSG
jgi:hypothetical protein